MRTVLTRPGWLFAVALAASYLLLHARALGFGYFDDDFYQVGQTWQTVGTAILKDPQFRPLFWGLFPLTNSVLGASPFTHHLVSHALHLLNCGLAFAVLRPRMGDTRAAIAVLAWNLLPQLAFPLGWIAHRNDPLLTLFLLGAILLHDRGRKQLAWAAAFAGYLSKVTAVAFPLAFTVTAGLRRYPGDFAAGLVLFAVSVALSAWAVQDDPLKPHLADFGPVMLALNALKNFVLGNLTWWIPVPFLGGPVEIAGWVVCLTASAWLLAVHGRRDATVTSLAVIALLLSLPLAKNMELRITYTMSLFVVAAVVAAIRPPAHDRRARIVVGAAIAGLIAYGVPATWNTLDGFQSDVRDVTAVDLTQDANAAYPVAFYPWSRDAQQRWLGR